MRGYRKLRYKRKTGFERLLDCAASLPWWLSVLLAVVTFLLFDYFSDRTPDLMIDSRQGARHLVRQVKWDTIFLYLKYIIPTAFCVGSLVNLIRRTK